MSMPSHAAPSPAGEHVSEALARLADAAIGASRVLANIDSEALAALDLTHTQYRVLVVLARPGPHNVISLAEALDVTQSTMSRTCERLVRRRLVSRRPSRVDRREVRLALSVAGSDLLEEYPRVRREKVAAILSNVPHEQRDHLAEALVLFTGAITVQASGGSCPKAC